MTGEYGVPDDRCGFKLSSEYIDSIQWEDLDRWCEDDEGYYCRRKTWGDTNQCIWHAKVKNKPVEALKAARSGSPELLNGAYLVGVIAPDYLSFRGCDLRSAIFSNGVFSHTEFHDANLSHAEFHDATLFSTEFHDANLYLAKFPDADLDYAEFPGANLSGASFSNAYLSYAKFNDATLSHAEFQDATLLYAKFDDTDLSGAEFHNANLSFAKFPNADLSDAKFPNTNLSGAEFPNSHLPYAEFSNADLSGAEFPDTYLPRTKFCDADLSNVDYTDANVRETDFNHATLHDALFTRTDCRGATFTNALLYETVFADTRINSQTTFSDSSTSRPIVVYEKRSHLLEDLPGGIHPLEAAEWVYRRLEKLHDENALSEQTREFHISKEEARRAYQDEQRNEAREEFYDELGERDVNRISDTLKTVLHKEARFYASTLQWRLTRHGESLARILTHSAGLILVCGFLYPFVGGFESGSTGTEYQFLKLGFKSVDGIPLPRIQLLIHGPLDFIGTLLQGIYFSIITFTTIGYGDLYPTGVGSKLLVGFESLSGAILVALFVFVLGRRVAR